MLISRSKYASQTHGLANQYYKAVVISKNTLCAERIVATIQPVLRLVYVATDDGELRWALSQQDTFQLVIIDADRIGSLYGLMEAIQST